MASVLVPVSNGFEEIEFVAIVDVLRRGGVEVVTAALEDEKITGANGITMIANTKLEYVDPNEFDMVVLPGGHDNMIHLKESDLLKKILAEFDQKGKKVGAICASPVVLGNAGVIKDRFTCYPGYEADIEITKYTDNQNVIVDRNIITSRGPGTAICFALEIVRELVGEETYTQLKEGLLADYC